MRSKPPKRIDVKADVLREIVRRSRERALTDEEHEILEALLDTTLWLKDALQTERLSAKRLYRMLFGPSSEKTKVVLPKDEEGDGEDADGTEDKGEAGADEGDRDDGVDGDESDEPKKGHGRTPASAYRGADKVSVGHESLKPGDKCGGCERGKLYPVPPKVVVRVTGGAPLAARVYECERLRCGSCGKLFSARPPPDARGPKYDERAAAMIALLRYGYGLPHNRLDKLQRSLGIPLPASTQYQVVKNAADAPLLAFDELVRHAAQGELLHNDDTTMPVLALTGKRRAKEAPDDDPDDRTGMFTTGIASVLGDRKIAVYITGRRHAGENLDKVLKRRDASRTPPLQMCDGLARNHPKDKTTIVANCMSHARRHFVDVVDNFPSECAHVFDELGKVFKNDDHCRTEGMNDEERLAYHVVESKSVMDDLKDWVDAQFKEKRVEPNSGLGQAFEYMRKRWDALTLFLRQSGAPLTNNLVERFLKRAIVHRKNSLFFRSLEGARIGDAYMSLIHTAELCGADPFDYLVALMRHSKTVADAPAEWMPWNYTEARARLLLRQAA